MNIQSIYRPFLVHFRSQRKRWFHQVMAPQPADRILDVGGYYGDWALMDCPHQQITCLNLDGPQPGASLPAQFTCVRGDGRQLDYGSGAFDIAFSNSVIEHLGTFADQQRFAAEIRRVSRAYWVQTPNFWFPIEPHFLAPFVHFLPKTLQKKLLRYGTIWGLVTRPTPERVAGYLAELRLLTEREMRVLFPDARILVERFCGLKKSFIAVRPPPAGVRERPAGPL